MRQQKIGVVDYGMGNTKSVLDVFKETENSSLETFGSQSNGRNK